MDCGGTTDIMETLKGKPSTGSLSPMGLDWIDKSYKEE